MRISYTNDFKIRKGFILAICIAFLLILLLTFPAFFKFPFPPNKVILTNVQIYNIFMGLSRYYNEYGKYPVGTNKEIATCLQGKDSVQNPKNIIYLNLTESKIKQNDNGELLDAWGTPLKIELNSDEYKLFIMSFGANKKDDNGKNDDIELTWPDGIQDKTENSTKSKKVK